MRRIGVTGSRVLTIAGRQTVKMFLEMLDRDSIIVHGACIGVDAYVAALCRDWGIPTIAVVPADQSRVSTIAVECSTKVEYMPEGTTYQDRNRRVLELGNDLLIAFPFADEHSQRSQRSGTWQTVRLARTQGIAIEGIVVGGNGIHAS